MSLVDNMLTTASELRRYLLSLDASIIEEAHTANPYFTEPNVRFAINAIATEFLEVENLKPWLARYNHHGVAQESVGLILAGNLPLVGFHDLLCVMLTGHLPVVKLSHKDSVLMKAVLNRWNELVGEQRVEIVEQLDDVTAAIATGSDNSSRYFEYKLGAKPHIFRKNRNGVAVISGEESTEELNQLAQDTFLYFGLGCRSVSKLFVPIGFDLSSLFESFAPWESMTACVPYRNNFRYQLAIAEMHNEPFFTNGFMIIKESKQLSSPVAVLHYEWYQGQDHLRTLLAESSGRIQCITTSLEIPSAIPFGSSQRPRLQDYADGIDTMEFLLSIN